MSVSPFFIEWADHLKKTKEVWAAQSEFTYDISFILVHAFQSWLNWKTQPLAGFSLTTMIISRFYVETKIFLSNKLGSKLQCWHIWFYKAGSRKIWTAVNKSTWNNQYGGKNLFFLWTFHHSLFQHWLQFVGQWSEVEINIILLTVHNQKVKAAWTKCFGPIIIFMANPSNPYDKKTYNWISIDF